MGSASRAEAVLIGGVSFGSAAVLSAAVLAWLAGALHPWVSVASLAAGTLAAFVAARQAKAAGEPWTPWEWLAAGAFALVSLRQFLWLVFERDGALLTLLPYNYGDLPLHWTYVQQIASGARFWPENPILTHERLRYPVGVDLLTAVVVSLGPSLPLVLKAMGLFGSLLAALALRRWGGAFAVAGFLFCGGLGVSSLLGGRLVDVDAQVAWKNLYLALSCRSAASCSRCPPASCCSRAGATACCGTNVGLRAGSRRCSGGRCRSSTFTRSHSCRWSSLSGRRRAAAGARGS